MKKIFLSWVMAVVSVIAAMGAPSDLAAFNLVGNVKEVKCYSVYDGNRALMWTAGFSPDGKLVVFNGTSAKVNYNAAGLMASLTVSDENELGDVTETIYELTYNDKGQTIKVKCTGDEGSWNLTYGYSPEGNLCRMTESWAEDEPGNYTYTYEVVDSRGNWLERTQSAGADVTTPEVREISYYD